MIWFVTSNIYLKNQIFIFLGNHSHTITYKSRLTQKKLHKKTDAIFSIYGKNGIIPWHFFLNSQLGLSRSLRSNENRGQIFEAATSKFCNHSWHFFSSPQNGKVDLCMTNGSKVLIYLTLLHFLLHYLQEYSKIWNIEKSNKSELWNRLSYRGLPYHFEVRS